MTTLPLPGPSLLRRPLSPPPRALVAITVLVALAAVPLLLAALIDTRQFQGEGVWIKPLKFHLALTVYTGTLAAFARLLPPGSLASRGWRVYVGIVLAAILAELVWIGGAAALATGSHFNTTGIMGPIYGLMGLAAVTLTSLAGAMGVLFWRRRADPLMLALALGLILTFGLTLVTAGTLSSLTGHHVGLPATGARLPLMGWSTEVGDLRLPHFLATHAMHAVPLAGLTGSRTLVWAAAAGWTALVLWAFVRALSGLPLFWG